MKGEIMKRNISKKIVGVAATVLACASLVTGCASTNLNSAVAVVKGEEIPFGVAKFDAKMQQITYESYYGSMFGANMWNQKLSGDETFGESTLKSILEDLEKMYVVDQHAGDYSIALTEEETAGIKATAAQFVADNDKKALEAMGANEEMITQYLTKYTIQQKVEAAIKAGADTNVSDEDAAQKTFSYVLVSTSGTTDASGNTTELTDEEKAAKKAQAQAIVDAVAGGTDFDTAVKAAGLTVSSASYGKDDDAGMDAAVITAADALEEGATSQIVEVKNGYYVLKLVSTFDQEQTDNRRTEIISDRQKKLYDDTYTQWKDASKITVDEKLWKKVNFEDKLTMVNTAATDGAATDATATDASTTQAAPAN
jgi:parvulin-like peptidyl-prolyl isomerase